MGKLQHTNCCAFRHGTMRSLANVCADGEVHQEGRSFHSKVLGRTNSTDIEEITMLFDAWLTETNLHHENTLMPDTHRQLRPTSPECHEDLLEQTSNTTSMPYVCLTETVNVIRAALNLAHTGN